MISEFQKPLESLFHAKSEPSEVMDGIDLSNKTVICLLYTSDAADE